MNQLYFNLKKSYEIIAFMAKELCDCLLHFAGRKSGFRDAGNLCWESPGHTASSGAAALTPLLRSLFTMRHNLMYFLRFPSHILKAKSPFASENNSSEVSSAVPHPTLLTICKQLASGFLIKKGWLTPSITIPTKLESKHTHTKKQKWHAGRFLAGTWRMDMGWIQRVFQDVGVSLYAGENTSSGRKRTML